MKSLQDHHRDVLFIQDAIKNTSSLLALDRSGTCCSRSFDYKKDTALIDISRLNEIIEINEKEQYIVLEPLVTMRQLVHATIKKGLSSPVITELAQMTVGGALQGLGGESSSFRYGFLDDSVLEYEVVLGDGILLTVKANQHADLFNAIPGSFGSLGIVTKIKLRLIPTARYVRITYDRLDNIESVQAIFAEVANDKSMDFIECVALSKNDFRLVKGSMENRIGLINWLFKRCKLSRYYHRWFFNHLVENSKQKGKEQWLTYEDYVFRWNRGNFWTAVIELEKKYSGRMRLFFIRMIFGWLMVSKNLYKIFYKKTLQQREEDSFYQDLLVPLKEMKIFFNYLDETVNVYPIWLIPVKTPTEDKLFSIPGSSHAYYVDFGIWGPYKGSKNFVELNRDVEHCLGQLDGRKWLWGQGYYEESEFWHVYDLAHYEGLRRKYKAEGRFISIYLKVTELYRSFIKQKEQNLNG